MYAWRTIAEEQNGRQAQMTGTQWAVTLPARRSEPARGPDGVRSKARQSAGPGPKPPGTCPKTRQTV